MPSPPTVCARRARGRTGAMYIGGGVIVLILIILLVLFFVRR
jgi:hypothetical protein